MDFIISFLNTILPIFYFAATWLYAKYFFSDEKYAEKNMQKVLRVTVVLHYAEVLMRGFYYHHFPTASVFEALSVIALCAVTIYLFLEWRLQVKTTGYFILILIFFMQLISSAFISFTPYIPEILHSPYFAIHTTAAITAYSAFAIAFLYSIMYLMLFHDIKGSRFSVIYNRLPSLEVLSNLNTSSATLGWVFLTIAIILGAVWSRQAFGRYLSIDPKIIIVFITWLIFGLEIIGSRFLKWSSRRLAYFSLAGFSAILFSMVAVNLFLTSFHEFK
ncbi:MAG: c-type cytochrome biogenesis protein CcsB [Calditrichia bacterium]